MNSRSRLYVFGLFDRHASRGLDGYAIVRTQIAKEVTVYKKPGDLSTKDETLTGGAPVYICDEVEGWKNIYFGNICAQHFENGLASTDAKTNCHAGWVQNTDLEIVSG
jgi:hypothetical protein